MPGYLTHLTAGLVLGGAAAAGAASLDWVPANAEALAPLVAVCALAALFPDVDTPSKGRTLFGVLLLAAILGLMAAEEYRWAALAGVAGVLPNLGPHRGWTHAFWAAVLVPTALCLPPLIFYETPVEMLAPPFCFGVLGYGSHLALDRVM